MKNRTMIATAAAVFAASTFVAASASAGVQCPGANACKGQGFTETGSTIECTVIKSK